MMTLKLSLDDNAVKGKHIHDFLQTEPGGFFCERGLKCKFSVLCFGII